MSHKTLSRVISALRAPLMSQELPLCFVSDRCLTSNSLLHFPGTCPLSSTVYQQLVSLGQWCPQPSLQTLPKYQFSSCPFRKNLKITAASHVLHQTDKDTLLLQINKSTPFWFFLHTRHTYLVSLLLFINQFCHLHPGTKLNKLRTFFLMFYFLSLNWTVFKMCSRLRFSLSLSWVNKALSVAILAATEAN